MYVYLAIIIQILLTSYSLYLYRNNIYLSNISNVSFIIYLILSTLLILIISFLSLPLWFKFILFMIYAIIYAGMLHNISFLIPKNIITQFLIGILISFILLTIFFYIFSHYNYNITFFGFILLGLIIGTISCFIIKLHYNYTFDNINIKNINDINDINETNIIEAYNNNHIYILYIFVIIFSIYFSYSTNVMMRIDYDDDFITAAVNLYLGFFNTILYLAELDHLI